MSTGEKRIKSILRGMKQRCYNQNSYNYERYGGRGISICHEWKTNTQTFVDWAMSHGYADDLTIDRIDNNGNYEPDNCRWATIKEQNNNRSTNIILTYNGKTQDIKQWADELGICYLTLWNRYKSGWDTKRMFEEPVHDEYRNRYPDVETMPEKSRQSSVKDYQRRNAGIRTLEQRLSDAKKEITKKKDMIYKVMMDNPGISVRDIEKETGIPRSTVQRIKAQIIST